MNIPIYEIPFGIHTLDLRPDDLGIDFSFINVDGNPQLVVGYEKRPREGSDVLRILNKGIVTPVAGLHSSTIKINSMFDTLKPNDLEAGETLELNPAKRFVVSDLRTNKLGDFNNIRDLQASGQKLSELIPSGLDATTSVYVKNRSIARVQGDTNLNSGLTTLELREVASAFTSDRPEKKKPNSLERQITFKPPQKTDVEESFATTTDLPPGDVLPQNTAPIQPRKRTKTSVEAAPANNPEWQQSLRSGAARAWISGASFAAARGRLVAPPRNPNPPP